MTEPRSASDSIVISAPLSFAGSAQRIWPMTRRDQPVLRGLMIVVAGLFILLAWATVLLWYCVVGPLVIPYRLVRREERRRRRDEMSLLEMRRARTPSPGPGTS